MPVQSIAAAPHERRVVVTGASGFVGRRLAPVLRIVGWDVCCVSRDAASARRRWPDLVWRQADLTRAQEVERVLEGCQMAYYLVHRLAEGSGQLVEREQAQAEIFARAAERSGVGRIVYLGATSPQGPPSEHLRSRLEVGRVLRTSRVPTLELRAGMVVGYGSASWEIVRDLAARLPAMVLPRWLRTRSQPVAIDDVIVALATAARIPVAASIAYDLPGPEILSYREIITRTARLLGHQHVPVLEVPVLTPTLSSGWIRLVTMADWAVARELVLGLTHDLLARSDEYWQLIAQPPLVTFDEAARMALMEEAGERWIPPPARALEAVVDVMTGSGRS